MGVLLKEIDKELERRLPKKTINVLWDGLTDAGYQWQIAGRRVYPDGKHGDGVSCLHSDRLQAFFKKHKITHVNSTFNETSTSDECIKDGVYTVAAYLKWWRRGETEG
jgi:hypothetical protein